MSAKTRQKVADKRARRAKRERRGLTVEQRFRAMYPNVKREATDER